jgi:hypothetical protein
VDAFKGDLKQFQVLLFLRNFKDLMVKSRLRPVNRKDHQKSLASLGLTREDAEREILSLTVENYCRGPEPDKSFGGEIWEFGKFIGGHEVYMKLKIREVCSEKFAICISFHPAESPICYPYNKGERK